MARRRILAPEFFTDAKLLKLPAVTRLFFAGLWCHADRVGVFRDEPDDLALRILPRDIVSGEEILSALAAGGFVVRYVGPDGGRYGWIRNWTRYQAPRNERESGFPYPTSKDLENRPVMHASVSMLHASASVRLVAANAMVLPVAPEINPPESGPGSTFALSGGGGGGGGGGGEDHSPTVSGAQRALPIGPAAVASPAPKTRKAPRAKQDAPPAASGGPPHAKLVEVFAEEFLQAIGRRYVPDDPADYVLAAKLARGGATPDDVRDRARRAFHPGMGNFHRTGGFKEFASKFNSIAVARINGNTHNVASKEELEEDFKKYGMNQGEL